MDQKLLMMKHFGNSVNYNLCGDFAYQLLIVGLQNKAHFLHQYHEEFHLINQLKNDEKQFSKIKYRFVTNKRRRKKRSKRKCKYLSNQQ